MVGVIRAKTKEKKWGVGLGNLVSPGLAGNEKSSRVQWSGLPRADEWQWGGGGSEGRGLILLIFSFLTVLCGMWDLCSLTMD